ncbi:hypothetical protein HYV79_01995 [Candidatus Woesearchaeota archaeon]|nr:hypothetical protein [Candidatus Woesearchaeota archaeon]
MNKLRKTFGLGALVFALTGCESQPQYLEGRVTKESGTVVNIVESSRALFGNESVKFGKQTYVLTVETSQGRYIINVREGGSKPLVALAEAIEVGDKVRFRTDTDFLRRFSKDRIGNVISNDIELIGRYY